MLTLLAYLRPFLPSPTVLFFDSFDGPPHSTAQLDLFPSLFPPPQRPCPVRLLIRCFFTSAFKPFFPPPLRAFVTLLKIPFRVSHSGLNPFPRPPSFWEPPPSVFLFRLQPGFWPSSPLSLLSPFPFLFIILLERFHLFYVPLSYDCFLKDFNLISISLLPRGSETYWVSSP